MNNRDDNKSFNEKDQSAKSDPGTLHTTDPEKNMEGPVSSSIRDAGKPFTTEETKEEADQRKDKHM